MQVSQPDADECQGACINLTNLSTVFNDDAKELHLTQRNQFSEEMVCTCPL